MVYVKHFDILGIETTQIPCVELQGPPTSATEGAVGLLGMDVTSEDKVVYICTAVNGAIYTWKSLKDGKDGVSVVKSEINGNGELVLTLSNGNTLNAGVVKGADGKDGERGGSGVGISGVQINAKGELILNMSNKTVKNVGVVKGADGEDGVSVVKAEINASHELILTLSNDTVMNLGSIKSEYAAETNRVNGLEIKRDANGVLKIDDIIIPQKQLLWTGATTITNTTHITWGIDKGWINDRSKLEIEFDIPSLSFSGLKAQIIFTESGKGFCLPITFVATTKEVATVVFEVNIANIRDLEIIGCFLGAQVTAGANGYVQTTIKKIYKIID